ncbi:MAG TPA: TonB-dependent receptor, partial [Thermoanaerobaculia bacterium]
LLDAAYGEHNGEVSIFAADPNSIRNEVAFIDDYTLAERQLGGEGNLNLNERDTTFAKASLEGIFDTMIGSHTLKFGAETEEHINFRDSNFAGGAQYTSFGSRYLNSGGITGADIAEGRVSIIEFDPSNPSDLNGLIDTINAMSASEKARYYGILDTNHDGTISEAEATANLVFNSTTGNPHGQINYQRDFQSAAGPQETQTEGLTLYLQDTIQWSNWAFNLGVRAERFEHFATTGESIYAFDWTYAPRLSAIYDIGGTGRQKVSAYYGRYYDPIRLNMTNFAGTLTGRVIEEQLFLGGNWVTYRTRGGPAVQDAFFSPTTKTPFTDEVQLSYQIDLGRNMSFETNAYRRQTRDILEDYDLELYADAAHADSCGDLCLGLGYFGYAANPGSNFVIGTLAGGKRDTDGVDLIFRKRYADNWQALVSYTYNDSKGNTNSDSSADFQGDVIWLDPRAPNQYGRQPGSIPHMLKFAGSYRLFDRLELGGVYNWNSGAYASRTFRASGRNLPNRVPVAYEYGGVTTRWIEEGAVGGLQNPSYGTLDLRAQWNQPLMRGTTLELFLDVFNALDDQAVIREQDVVLGVGTKKFGDPLSWVAPRRLYLGARFLF